MTAWYARGPRGYSVDSVTVDGDELLIALTDDGGTHRAVVPAVADAAAAADVAADAASAASSSESNAAASSAAAGVAKTAAEMARGAAESAQSASVAAASAASGSAAGADAARAAAESARDTAQGHAVSAGSARDTAVSAGADAETAASAAAGSASAAAASATSATGSASAASSSASTAQGYAATATNDAALAGSARSGAESARDEAEGFADDAEDAATRAGLSADEAADVVASGLVDGSVTAPKLSEEIAALLPSSVYYDPEGSDWSTEPAPGLEPMPDFATAIGVIFMIVGGNIGGWVESKFAELVGSAPEVLDTLEELAAALGGDPNFAANVLALIGTKVDDDDPRLSNARTPTTHVHDGEAITTGTIAAARLPMGTGASQVAAGNHTHTKSAVGLGAVDNTADVDKPISNAVAAALAQRVLATDAATALAGKADLVHDHAGYVRGQVAGTPTTLTLWTGTQAQYDAIGSPSSTAVYVITD